MPRRPAGWKYLRGKAVEYCLASSIKPTKENIDRIVRQWVKEARSRTKGAADVS